MTEPESNSNSIESRSAVVPGMKRFHHEAMATTFEVMVVHEDEKYARRVAAEAFELVNRLEAELSRFVPNSDISRINNLPAHQPLLLGLDAFQCLQLSCRIYTETEGAFDVTIGPVLNCWRNKDGSLRVPSKEELNLARRRTGTNLLTLNEDEHTIELSNSPVQIDLGGVGKGYAVNKIAEFLREWGIETALISGGYSSVLALEAPAGTKGWPLTISNPNNRKEILARPHLACRALGSSGIKKGHHIIDPRSMQPVEGKIAVWSSAVDAATADALSTAFMVMSPEQIEQYCSKHPDISGMIMLQHPENEPSEGKILRFGHWQQN
jgi:thiamine biosynthesis lipoprotein